MAPISKAQNSNSQHSRPTPVKKSRQKKKKCPKAPKKEDWEGVTCPVCLEFPHNAVLLLCSSFHKGCRPYMCATSQRLSNCLDQYQKADNSLLILGADEAETKQEVPELVCPLCRGQVKGCTVVEPARKHWNKERRPCMQEDCSFIGTYKKLKKHAKTRHPLARPCAVDPAVEEKWKKLERERERNDAIGTVISSVPGARVSGDYVIEPGYRGNHRRYGRFFGTGDYIADDDDTAMQRVLDASLADSSQISRTLVRRLRMPVARDRPRIDPYCLQ